jgi:hypothetical protein
MANGFRIKNDLQVAGTINAGGSVTGVTEPSQDNSAKLSSTAWVRTHVAGIVGSAPATLDTLNELAAALGNDPNFATTVANNIAGKQNQLNGTGFVKISGTNISYDNNTYLTAINSSQVISALGYTPYNASNPSGYITGITSGMVTTALGFTPYNSSNPAGYITGISFANVSAKPTTIAGYGITDSLVYTTSTYSNPSWITALAWSKITGAPAFLTSYTETDTLASVTGRGATTSTAVTFSGGFNATGTQDQISSIKFHRLHPSSGSPLNTDTTDSFILSKTDGGYGGGTLPSGSHNGFGVISLQTHSGGYFTQLGLDTNQNDLWIRSANNSSSFGSWIRIATRDWVTSQGYLTSVPTHNQAWSTITSTPTTLAGYGITDAVPSARTITINGTTLDLSANRSFTITSSETDTLSSVTARGNTTASGLIATASEGREVGTYLPGSYTTDDLVSGHYYKWYSDIWRLGTTRSGGQPAADFVLQFNGSRRLSITTDGNVIASVDMRAPIFYDSDNTTYYGDFAGTSWLRHLSVGNVNSPNDGGWNARINLTGSSHARLDVKSESDGIITTMYSHTGQGVGRVGTWSNHPLALMVNGGIGGYVYANYLQGVDSVRAPIFYDSNDTGRYIDPNGTSQTNSMRASEFRGNANVGGTGEATWHPAGIYTTGPQWLYGDMYKNNSPMYNVGYIGMSGANTTPIDIEGASHKYITIRPGNGYEAMVRYIGGSGSSWYVGKRVSTQLVDTTSFHFYSEQANATVFGVTPGGIAVASGDMRAPIFYDTANTAYFVDPASTSVLNSIRFGTSSNNSTLSGNSDWGARFSTNDGWIQIGPANTGHAHIYTDRGNFYFNKQLTVNGGSEINTSDIRSAIFYDSNDTGFFIDPASTSNLQGLTVASTITGNISGNSATVGGLAPSTFFNNMGQVHTTRTAFDASTPSYDFGFRFIQGNTNGPVTGGGSQFYSWYLGLGSDYSATGGGSYGMHVAIPRNATTPYMSVRYNENNSLGSWIKIAAGYADSAGSLSNMNISQFTNNSGYITGYTETDTLASVTARGASTSSPVTFNGNVGFFGGLAIENQSTFVRLAFNRLTFWDWQNGGDMLVLDNNFVQASDSFRAPIFYDSNDTSYYIDPTSGTSGYFAGVLRQNNGRFVRDSSYRTISGISDYYSDGSAGWYRAAEITLTGGCSGAVLYGTLYDHRFDGADAYQISIVARADCDFNSNNESHYINVGCTILGSTNYTNYRNKIRIVLSASSPNSRTYELQFFETAWNNDTWQLETTGWTVYGSAQAPRSSVGTPRVNYISNQNADYQRANLASYSPVFFDSDDDRYYLNPTSTTSIRTVGSWRSDSGAWDGEFAGKIQYHDSSWYLQGGNRLIFRTPGAAEPFTVNQSGTALATGDFRAPIFYDSNDTGFYVDPAGGSILGGTRFTTQGNALNSPSTPSANIGVWNGVFGFIDLSTSHGAGGWIDFSKANGTDFHGRIRYDNDSNSLRLFANSTEQVRIFDNNAEALGSFRAPIFFDSNDTSFYVNPNGLSRMHHMQLVSDWANTNPNEGAINIRGAYPSMTFRNTISGNMWLRHMDGSGHIQHYFAPSGVDATNWSIMHTMHTNGIFFSAADMRTPIFYDSNDTGFYLDPNSYSRLNRIGVGGAANDVSGININGDAGLTGANFFYFGHNNGLLGSWQTRTFASSGRQIWNTNGFEVNRDGYGGGWAFSINSAGSTTFNSTNDLPININGASNKYLTINPGNGYEAMVRYIGGSGSSWYVGKRTSGQLVGTQSFHFYSEEAGATVGGINPLGDMLAIGSMRAPIFYDSNNTAFYIDPASTSVLNGLTVSSTISGTTSGNVPLRTQSNWNDGTVIDDVIGLIAWKNYGSGHVIFDASNGTAPNGGPISNTNPQNNWTGTFPTLMGWNGTNTYGVRVDVARFAENAGTVGGYAASSLWRSDGGAWNPTANITLGQTGNNQEWSFDISRNGFTGGYWHVWDSTHGPMLLVDATGNFVNAPGSMRSPIFYDTNNTAFYFDGSATGDSIRVAGDVVAYFSDERLKDIKENIPNALDKVLSLNGFYYEPNEIAQELGYKKKLEVGVSAQEVERILPEIIKDAPIGQGYKTLDYGKLTPILIEAIKEQQQQINKLTQLINTLKN